MVNIPCKFKSLSRCSSYNLPGDVSRFFFAATNKNISSAVQLKDSFSTGPTQADQTWVCPELSGAKLGYFLLIQGI